MRSDSDIRRDVEDELRWDPEIDPTDIAVSVNNGVVTLIGFVRSYPERHLAEAATKRVAEVLAVANDLQVRLPDMDQRPDPEIRSRRHCTDQERTAVCMGKYPGGSEECSAYAGRRSRMELPAGPSGSGGPPRAWGGGRHQRYRSQAAGGTYGDQTQDRRRVAASS
jgi:hypothetical protein